MIMRQNGQISEINFKNDTELRIGIIGLGRMGLMHAALLNSLEGSKVIAASDPSNFPSGPLGIINPSIKIFRDAKRMLEETELDAVLISSPVSSHIPLSLLCANKKIPFLLEKPLSINSDEALPLIKKLENSHVTNMIGYVYRFLDSFVKGKQILDSGCLGKIQRIYSNIYISQLFKKGKGWRYDKKESGGGVLISLGSHVIDLLTWYFGNVNTVVGKTKSVYSPGIEDFAHLIMEHESGNISILDCSWSIRFKRKIDIKLDILGDNGTLVVSDDSVLLYLDKHFKEYAEGKTFFNANDLYSPVPIDIGTPKFTFQDKHFLDSIRSNTTASPDIKQGYHIQQIVDAGYKSSNEGCIPIKIK
jgi:predicted dehydrogenase